MTKILGNAQLFGDAVTDVGLVRLYPLGTVRHQAGATYRYVILNDAIVTAAAGSLCYRGVTATQEWVVSGDVSASSALCAVGVFMGVIANGGYGWVLTKGRVASLKKLGAATNTWALGTPLRGGVSATNDGKAARFVKQAGATLTGAELGAAAAACIGYALAAATTNATAGAAFIDLE